ncbi:CrcB family protein [Lentilactobacillus sp. Marseille-Q4993]|uniref:fluoride efflux transporter FluC n=1 Tax=Lentilactobacillus sp. Marseille-Q4993 TaxID=3039492 RepID=UPI0024BCD66B|nr:CrcB family protein [Lentilactobacillus sp. Marseille-Q4993]
MDEILIGLFAFLGGAARLGLDNLIPNSSFPFATITINVIGCFILALINSSLAVSQRFPAQLTLALGTGMIGAFTTFSSFSVEIIKLVSNHQIFTAIIYLVSSLAVGLLFALLGSKLGNKITLTRKRGQ